MRLKRGLIHGGMADNQFYTFLLAAFKNMAAHMAEGGSAYIFHADTEGLNFRRAFKEAGFHISGVCIWVKNSLVLGRSPYQWQHEPVLFGWLPNGKHKWFADRKQSTIWNFDKPKRNADHPTMKPITLLAYPIKNSSAPNAVVMDLFGGSGSTLMACEQTDRICRTMELDEKYATVIVERFHTDYPDQEITVLRDGQTFAFMRFLSAWISTTRSWNVPIAWNGAWTYRKKKRISCSRQQMRMLLTKANKEEKHMNWQRKLTSRKFWAAVADFVAMLLIALKVDEDCTVQVTALIMAGAGAIAYIIGEGFTDAAAAEQDTEIHDD